jgi:hypothetical protein
MIIKQWNSDSERFCFFDEAWKRHQITEMSLIFIFLTIKNILEINKGHVIKLFDKYKINFQSNW